MAQFHTTADVFAVVKPDQKGTFRCPIKGCSRRTHASAKDFGRHLAIIHKIPSDKHVNKDSGHKNGKSRDLPILTIKFCPHCGGRIEELEQAAELLRRTGK